MSFQVRWFLLPNATNVCRDMYISRPAYGLKTDDLGNRAPFKSHQRSALPPWNSPERFRYAI